MAYQPIWVARKNEILKIAHDVALANPDAWNELKIPGQESRTYINLVSIACIKVGIPAGVNLKRGGPQESIDALAFPNNTGAGDSTGTYAGLEIVDIVGGAEGPNPSLTWGDVTQKTIDAGTIGGWKSGSVEGEPIPQPPSFPYPDEPTAVLAYEKRVEQSYKAVGRKFPDENDPDAFRHFARYGYSCRGMAEPEAANKHIKELREELGAPPE